MRDYSDCRYKVAIRVGLVSDVQPVPTEILDREFENRTTATALVLEKYPNFKKADRLEVEIGTEQIKEPVMGPITLTVDDLQCHLDGLQVLKKTSRSRSTYVPIVFTRFLATPSKHERRRLAFSAILIGKLLGSLPTIGKVIYGTDPKFKKINLKEEIGKVAHAIQSIQTMGDGVNCESYFRLNRHCPECPYSVFCRDKAKTVDHLSLISGIGEKEIRNLNARRYLYRNSTCPYVSPKTNCQ